MKCPACPCTLTPFTSGSLALEGCREGCGGVWFDAKELDHVDEHHERVSLDALKMIPNANFVIDRARQRPCPKCESTALKRVYLYQVQELEIDGCPNCGGVWLDLGELSLLRDHHAFRAESEKIMSDFQQRCEAGTDDRLKHRASAVFKLLFD